VKSLSQIINFLRIVTPVIARRPLSIAQSRDFPGNNGENYFAHLIQWDDRLDLVSFLIYSLIVSPEYDKSSREETILFFSPVKK
jgi:hypothetical protein